MGLYYCNYTTLSVKIYTKIWCINRLVFSYQSTVYCVPLRGEVIHLQRQGTKYRKETMPARIHKQVSCKICYKTMRSNNASRHMKIHIIHTNENNALMCRELLDEMLDKVVEHEQPTRKRKLDGDVTEDNHPTSKRKCGENMKDVDELRKMLIERTDKYNRTVALGEQVYKILGEGEVKQGALPKDMQEALELYEKENNDFDLYKDTALYPWQQECMK